MLYRELIARTLARARRLQLNDPTTGQVDVSDIELAIVNVLGEMIGRFDLDEYTVINETMFATSTGADTYPLPEDFGRLITPKDDMEYGIFINDGNNDMALEYVTPEFFLRNKSTTNNRPTRFTITTNRNMRLDPAPDSNSDNHYTGKGVYIERITVGELDGEVRVTDDTALIDMTLGELAGDWGHANQQFLLAKKEQGINRLATRQFRTRQGFQGKSGRVLRQRSTSR